MSYKFANLLSTYFENVRSVILDSEVDITDEMNKVVDYFAKLKDSHSSFISSFVETVKTHEIKHLKVLYN